MEIRERAFAEVHHHPENDMIAANMGKAMMQNERVARRDGPASAGRIHLLLPAGVGAAQGLGGKASQNHLGMKGNHDNKIKTKSNPNIGGMNCKCCRIQGRKSEAKTSHSRSVRRRIRTTLKRGGRFHDE
jgi:hypothetical protein